MHACIINIANVTSFTPSIIVLSATAQLQNACAVERYFFYISYCLQRVVSLLVGAGANPCARDNLGGNAILEAVNNGRREVLRHLLEAGATLPLSKVELATKLCSLVMEGQEELLQLYISAGADLNVGDYDKRTPLHIAASEGNLAMVSTCCIAMFSRIA
jgi:ankyrin repeat protein